ncbi:MAG: PH domain-containing protein [Oscillospiraceae bacterium]|nr:PH domain-containing protein [Oscillospiraceae bacterium]
MARKTKMGKEEIVWKDRKRYFGLPLSFTRYRLSKDRLTLRRGFFKTLTDEVMVYRIMDIRMVQKFGQKLFRVGTVTLISTDKTLPTLELKNIKRPDEIRRFISNLVEQQRSARGIAGSELLGVGQAGAGGRRGPGRDPGRALNDGAQSGAGHDHMA